MIIQTEELKMIHLSEIDTVIFDSVAVSVSCALLEAFVNNKIGVVFCSEKHLPQSTITPISTNVYSPGRIIWQASWDDSLKDSIWPCIVKHKIYQQASVLEYYERKEESKLLLSYLDTIELGDSSNREGFAAKVYFNALFGADFTRNNFLEDERNFCLDYGYSILLALVAKEISATGYELALGIHHRGQTNPYNLACDLMEPFRPLVDIIVKRNFKGSFDYEIKKEFWNLSNTVVEYNNAKAFLTDAIKYYIRDVMTFMESPIINLKTYKIIW